MVPQDLLYTKEHEWLKVEGDEAVFGITDYAQSQLGDITFIELPEKEKEIKQSESLATVESVKAASDVYAPVSGKVIAINDSLQDTPEKVNQSPYNDGWICRIKIADAAEQKSLMDAAAYENYIQKEGN